MTNFGNSERVILHSILNSSYSVIQKTKDDPIKKSLMSGELGTGYFLSIVKYNGLLNDTGGLKIISDILNNGVAPYSNSICNGNAGVYWVLSKGNGKLFEFDNDFLDFLQHECFKGLKHEIRKKHFDYLHGAFGVLHALISARNIKEKELCEIVDLVLEASKEHLVFPTSYSPNEKEGINLHLSHGISAYIIILVELFNLSKNEEIAVLIDRHCRILKDNFNKDSFACFPFVDGGISYKVRNSWCYGDIGIGIALFKAYQALNNNDYYKIARYTWEKSCERRSKKKIIIYDSPLCHGIFGNLLMYNKIDNYLGGCDIVQDTISWYLEKIKWYYDRYEDDFLKCNEIAGFKNDRSYLTGVSGIGLTCLELLKYDSFETSKLLLL